MERVWQHIYAKELCIAPEDHPLLITETPLNPRRNRYAYAPSFSSHTFLLSRASPSHRGGAPFPERCQPTAYHSSLVEIICSASFCIFEPLEDPGSDRGT